MRAIDRLLQGSGGAFVVGAALPGRNLDVALLRAYELAVGRVVKQDVCGARHEQFTYTRTRKTAAAIRERSVA